MSTAAKLNHHLYIFAVFDVPLCRYLMCILYVFAFIFAVLLPVSVIGQG